MEKYIELVKVFEKNKNENNAVDMANYMQNNFTFYGINAKLRKEIEKPFINNEKKSKKIDWDFLKMCYQDCHREIHYFALDCLESLNKYLKFSDIDNLEYFVRNNQWWDSIDKLDRIIGNIAFDNTDLDILMIEWSKSENMWYRRLAIDHQINRKLNTNTQLLKEIIFNNLGSKEFFINKAIGWSLREYSKYNLVWVKNFVTENIDKLNSLSIREASKYF